MMKRLSLTCALWLSLALSACATAPESPSSRPSPDLPVSPLQSPLVDDNLLRAYDLVYHALSGGARHIYRQPPNQPARQLTSSGLSNVEPDWSPDGAQIVYTASMADGRYELYVMNADGSNARRLLQQNFAYNWGGRWSPDGKQIAFASNESGYSQIYLVGLDGENPRQMTFEGNNFLPAWSPDGRRIAFTSDRSGGGDNEIYVMNNDGSQVEQITDNDVDDAAPAWSPNGKVLAYHSFEQGAFNIHLYDLDSRQSNPLTRESLPVRFPSWTPDGRHILATQELVENKSYVLLVVDARNGQIISRLPDAQNARARLSAP